MIRPTITFAALLLAGVLAEAGVAPPIPRLPSAAFEKAEPAEPLGPEQLAERIQKNTREAGERLAGQDTGGATRQSQNQALKDLDELLKQAQNPMGGGGGQDQQQDDQSQQNQSGSPMESGMKPPFGGSSQKSQKNGWRDRQDQKQGGGSARKQPGGGSPQQAKAQKPAPMGQGQSVATGQNVPMNPNGNNPGGGTKGVPALPLDDAITKQVWGHLPERLRQQMSQYYKEQFMPKYSEMLRQYYASLAEREKAQRKP